MITEKSAGIVVFRKNNSTIEYLILKYGTKHWDFPKGHLEGDETSLMAAIRETKEETGLDVRLVEGFKDKISYIFRSNYSKGEIIYKEVLFFLGEVDLDNKVKLSEEHSAYKWESFETALDILTFDNAKKVLKNAHNFYKNL